MGLCYLFQVGLKPLLFFMSFLHFLALLFEHFGIILGNIKKNGRKHDGIKER